MKTATREMMKKEAIRRLKCFGVHPNAVKEFEKEDKLNYSEQTGALYWLEGEWEDLARKWEAKTGNMVFHGIHCRMGEDEMLNLLYVSKYPEEWEYDKQDMDWGMHIARTINLTYDPFTETGTIGVKPLFGGIIRTY